MRNYEILMKKNKNEIKKYNRKYYKIKNKLDYLIYYKNNIKIILNNKIKSYKKIRYYNLNNLYKNKYDKFIKNEIKILFLKYKYNKYNIDNINKLLNFNFIKNFLKNKNNYYNIDIKNLFNNYFIFYHKIKKYHIKNYKLKYNHKIDDDNLLKLIFNDIYNLSNKFDKYEKINIHKLIYDINFKIINQEIEINSLIEISK